MPKNITGRKESWHSKSQFLVLLSQGRTPPVASTHSDPALGGKSELLQLGWSTRLVNDSLVILDYFGDAFPFGSG
jgi:hypothetical protein